MDDEAAFVEDVDEEPASPDDEPEEVAPEADDEPDPEDVDEVELFDEPPLPRESVR